jgi:hypothetical protein
MSRWLKLLCIWCLIVVLPLQSVAAGCRLACAAPQATADAVAAEAGPASHPCHPGAAEAGAALGAADDDGAAGTDHRCNACSACCAVAALPVGVLQIGTPEAVRDGVALLLARPTSVVVAGLERPPRTTVR